MLNGLMQHWPLRISALLAHAERFHRSARLVTRRGDGSLVERGYADLAARAAQLGHALLAHGIGPGDRVATIAWNDDRHLDAYFGITGIGAVCHTINPRLFPEQICQIITDARDRILMVDPDFLPALLARSVDLAAAGVERIVVLDDALPVGASGGELALGDYDSFLAGRPDTIAWPALEEETAALLCYTSGTTGMPKGVLYSHRATVLHAMAVCMADVFGLRAVDRIMPVVPMYHVNAWGLPFAAALTGSGLVLPGPRATPADLLALIRAAGVTATAGVPTVWLGLAKELRESGPRLEGLRIVSGGAALPVSLARELSEDFGIQVNHAWGMTEMSPVGLVNTPKPENADWPQERWIAHQTRQGRPLFGVEMRVVDQDGAEVAMDGTAFGELLVRGPWIARGYFNREENGAVDAQGWFHTGDIVTMDASGYVQIVDRAKDVIKSGGEWISSIELENIAVGHPKVEEAAVIAARHERWDERPLLIVTARDPADPPTRAELLGWYEGRIARWWTPDDVVVVDCLPHTGTGKLLKTELKERFRDHLLGTPEAGAALG